jgi:hypothetical protein
MKIICKDVLLVLNLPRHSADTVNDWLTHIADAGSQVPQAAGKFMHSIHFFSDMLSFASRKGRN